MTVEAMLMFPILVWVLLATFVFFNSFRAEALNLRVAFTITDVLSREGNEPITPEVMDSLYSLQGFMLASGEPYQLRVSAVRFDAASNAYKVVWSQVRGEGAPMSDARLAQLRDRLIPIMSDQEVQILVETSADYRPAFQVGLSDRKFRNFIAMRPRFVSTLCWSASNDPPWIGTDQVC